MMSLEKLIEAAKREEWEVVDREIPEACKRDSVIEWAVKKGIKDKNGNVRDLAVSILEKAPLSETRIEEIKEKLYPLMVSDSNKYVRYRVAFTFAAHRIGDYKEEVKKLLREAEQDKEVSEIARRYRLKLD